MTFHLAESVADVLQIALEAAPRSQAEVA
jgi:hypothetical protein